MAGYMLYVCHFKYCYSNCIRYYALFWLDSTQPSLLLLLLLLLLFLLPVKILFCCFLFLYLYYLYFQCHFLRLSEHHCLFKNLITSISNFYIVINFFIPNPICYINNSKCYQYNYKSCYYCYYRVNSTPCLFLRLH